jgi:hypothetical protein
MCSGKAPEPASRAPGALFVLCEQNPQRIRPHAKTTIKSYREPYLEKWNIEFIHQLDYFASFLQVGFYLNFKNQLEKAKCG